MLTEFELRQLKHYRAMANELINPLVPENSVECCNCGCRMLYANEDTLQIHCAGCNMELDGFIKLEE